MEMWETAVFPSGTPLHIQHTVSYNPAQMRYCLIGPTYPYRGGIAHYTTLLAKHLREANEVLLLSFSKQYPTWLFPGESDRDPSAQPIHTEAEYLLDPLNPLTWRRTLQAIKAWQPNMVIMQWWHPYFAPAWAVLSRAIKRQSEQTQLVFICHNVLPHEQGGQFSQWLLPQTIKLAIGAADRFIVHSESDGKTLQSIMPNVNFSVTPLPTYEAVGQQTNVDIPVELPEERPLLLFCGFVRPYKGLDILIDALPQVLAKRPLYLLVAGEFWQGGETQYQQQIKSLGIEDSVTILNKYIPDELLAALLHRANVVVLPYRSATQSAIIQVAFGHQRPVITTDVGGLAEAVRHGITGLVVPPEDPTALANAILHYFDEGLEGVFVENIGGENGRFSWEKLINNFSIG
ncbi:MAG: glycosyltransferase [Chloroflexi bacterium]|nr:MAG: glycosyltransferase [Chloroflexota bacterium]